MPNYDYRCDSCEHQFEVFQLMSAKPLKKCPECGKAVRRLIGGGAGIIFKGSGFYQTDYRSKNYHDTAQKEKPVPKASDGSCASGGPCKQPEVCSS